MYKSNEHLVPKPSILGVGIKFTRLVLFTRLTSFPLCFQTKVFETYPIIFIFKIFLRWNSCLALGGYHHVSLQKSLHRAGYRIDG